MFDAGILGLLEHLGQPHGIFARLWELLPLQFGQALPQFFMHIGFAGVLSAVPFAGRGSGILARFVMPCWRHG